MVVLGVLEAGLVAEEDGYAVEEAAQESGTVLVRGEEAPPEGGARSEATS